MNGILITRISPRITTPRYLQLQCPQMFLMNCVQGVVIYMLETHAEPLIDMDEPGIKG